MNNSGTVDAESGTLSLSGGGTIDGQFYAASGAAVTFDGTFTSGAAPLLGGPGVFQFTGGTLTLLNDAIPNLQMLGGTLVLGPAFQGGSITNLTLTGMTLTGTNTVAGNGVMNWSGGAVAGSLTVASNAVLNIGGSGTKQLQGPLTNAGTVVWTGSGGLQVFYAPSSYYGRSTIWLARCSTCRATPPCFITAATSSSTTRGHCARARARARPISTRIEQLGHGGCQERDAVVVRRWNH